MPDVMHMKGGLIEKTIEEFKNRRLGVYKADPDQIVRDTRVAERATKDHVGRWLFELLQNSDDAKASEVRIIIEKDTIYVADNGHGFKPEAVSAICGTDFSDKTTGTIGRKGVGFKSVYEVSQNPQLLIVNGEGIEFSRARAKAWLQQNNLDDCQVPYQWIPFFITWDDMLREDPKLVDLSAYMTVVRLPGLSQIQSRKVEQQLKELPPHALFAFRHLRKITAPELEIVLSAGDGTWSLCDSRGQIPAEWRVRKYVEHPPAGMLESLGADERQAISKDGVSFLIAAPLENNHVIPTTEYLPVHVFYPTEQKGPVRLLLHAEFLVKSDRTALMPVDGNPFNAWVAEKLAYHVCRFVNDAHHQEAPSRHAALLLPFSDRTSHPVAESLWRCIADEAKKCLRLADVEGCQRLSLEEARLISVSVRPDLARTLLGETGFRGRLMQPAFDEDQEARKALKELGCKEIHDQDLMAAIAENADSLAGNTGWVWACWQWLADWVAEKPYGEERKKRIERAKSLPIVPVDGRMVKASDLAELIVTWRPDASVTNLPDWLPLAFVDDWFSGLIEEAEQQSPVKKLSMELRIEGPKDDLIQRAVGQAIKQYWEDKQGDPECFLRFILEQDWHETVEVSDSLKRCPVPLSQPVQGEEWAEACRAYFGREWGNELLAELYAGIEAVAWVACDCTEDEKEKYRQVFRWLGVVDYPRIVDELPKSSVWDLPEACGEWKRYLDKARDPEGRGVYKIACVTSLDHIAVGSLDQKRALQLTRLIAKHWDIYYQNHTKVSAYGSLSRERHDRTWHVKAKWWWEVCEYLSLPRRDGGIDHIPFTALWVPDMLTSRALGDLLPAIDLVAFGEDKDAVRNWLINSVGLRTRIEQVTIEEWKKILSKYIPDKAPAERLLTEDRLRDKVTGWYAACLENAAEQENVAEKIFSTCPLLCRKGDVWQYVADDLRYFDDDNDLGTAFAEDVWLFHIPARLSAAAVTYFGVQNLSESVRVNIAAGEPKSPLSCELNQRFSESLPYVWAWRSSQSKQAADRLSRLKSLKVLIVPALKASLTLDGLRHEVERRWFVDDDKIYLHKDHANEAELAQALAKALGVRSEADFYENLFRCTNDRQRKEKLLSKGIPEAEIDRCLREYSGSSSEVEPGEGPGKPTKGERSGNEHLSGGSQKHQLKKSPEGQPSETSEGKPSGTSDDGRQPLSLKDANTTSYYLGRPHSGGAGIVGTGEVGGTEGEGRSLTDAEKTELEEAGRTFAARELERMGFSVEKMPQGNPGFDLRAKKGVDELRVEVKAHSGRATVVDVTQREYKEYLSQQGYHWELWNVEHLSADDSHTVVITRYDQIPDEAINARSFRVDLKLCRRKLQD